MKTLKILCALALTLGSLSASFADDQPKPDLHIGGVQERGKTATICVVNTGRAASKACVLRIYRPGERTPIAQITIPAIGACRSLIVTVTANGIELNPTTYVIDATNVVQESDETNNVRVVP